MISRKFFLIDDDRDDKELFTEAIGSVDASVSCISADHGKDALTKLLTTDTEPDIIFLDIDMPIMNGWQFLSKVKDTDKLKDIPVIMYSTSSRHSDYTTALSSGALCFFTKPNSFTRLKKILQIVITHMEKDSLEKVCEAITKA